MTQFVSKSCFCMYVHILMRRYLYVDTRINVKMYTKREKEKRIFCMTFSSSLCACAVEREREEETAYAYRCIHRVRERARKMCILYGIFIIIARECVVERERTGQTA